MSIILETKLPEISDPVILTNILYKHILNSDTLYKSRNLTIFLQSDQSVENKIISSGGPIFFSTSLYKKIKIQFFDGVTKTRWRLYNTDKDNYLVGHYKYFTIGPYSLSLYLPTYDLKLYKYRSFKFYELSVDIHSFLKKLSDNLCTAIDFF